MKYRYVLGIDASLASTGIVLLEVNGPDIAVVHTDTLRTRPDEQIFNRQVDVLIDLAAICKRFELSHDNTIVALEDYGSSKIRGKLYERVELTGQIKLLLSVQHGFGIYTIAPTSLKTFLGTTSRAKKAGVKDAALYNFGFSGGNEHIRDAYCLCRYLLAFLYGQRLRVRFFPSMRGFLGLLQPSANKPGRLRQLPLTPRKQPLTLAPRPAKASRNTHAKA